jgi:hypothetical protein
MKLFKAIKRYEVDVMVYPKVPTHLGQARERDQVGPTVPRHGHISIDLPRAITSAEGAEICRGEGTRKVVFREVEARVQVVAVAAGGDPISIGVRIGGWLPRVAASAVSATAVPSLS